MQRGGRAAIAAILAATVLSGARAASPPGWTTYGGEPGRTGFVSEAVAPATVKPSFVLPVRGRVISQVLAARDVPSAGLTTLYAATTAGLVYAVSESGYVRWRVDLGQLSNPCAQLDGYGVGGTPVIDAASHALYVADALGRLHALDLSTGAELPGWPVTLYSDPANELVWGALALADGRVYVPTGSYCDAGPFSGKVVAVDLQTREVSTWTAAPPELGGGGAIWGWGGVAYDRALDRLLVVTGNAFEGGTNRAPDFDEAAGLAESLVSLKPDLSVVGASHPSSVDQPLDLDFVGSPLSFDRPGCGELAVAGNKNAQVFGWRADDIGAGPIWTVDLERFDPNNPLLSQLAYDPQRSALYAVTGARIVRVDIRPDCSAAVRWSRELQTDSLNGSPTVAGDAIWFARSGTPRLLAVEPDSGRTLVSLPLPGLTVTAPTVVDGRVIVGTFTGQLVGFSSSSAATVPPGPPSPGVPGHSTWLDRHAWVSRETGVWSTDDAGRHWRRIFPQAAVEVVRTSVSAGVIRVAGVTRACACAYDLWTTDGGRHWTATRAIAGGLTGRGAALYWIAAGGTSIQQVLHWPPKASGLSSRTIATVESGAVLSLALVPEGVAALVKDSSTGSVSVVVVRGGDQESVSLPLPPAPLIDATLSASGDEVIVEATVYSEGKTNRVRWTSTGDSSRWEPVAD